ncbi:hypothetical protein A5893_02280 [Pedobacter psychrophilus]|uniref:Uncharacterized protein n=1 Tax=Pedobacter psychrophilus TaxID=1826909 RepID=A0A179DLK6_9SPHI|nr:hypothetical protein [Pedobacter psychrophilus]OAQ41967.1 hypothetical protein A5893_02280 [Pedobacter psychrophilus]
MYYYYLETNALYNIKNISVDTIKNCYTSVLSIIELVSGIKDDSSYRKRKAILNLVFESKITIDFAMPDEIIFNSFDIFTDYEFIEERIDLLLVLVKSLIESESYDYYIKSDQYNHRLGHEYFKNIDNEMSKRFIFSSNLGAKAMRQTISIDSYNNAVIIDNKEFNLNSTKKLGDFFDQFPELNSSMTINALSKMILNFSKIEDFSLEDVYNSYNGLVKTYVSFFSKYCITLIVNGGSPAKNDFVDLTHLIYMKNNLDTIIISDDNLFKKLMGDKSKSISELK